MKTPSEELIRELYFWLKRPRPVAHVETGEDMYGNATNSYAAVQFPSWDVLQKIALIEEYLLNNQ